MENRVYLYKGERLIDLNEFIKQCNLSKEWKTTFKGLLKKKNKIQKHKISADEYLYKYKSLNISLGKFKAKYIPTDYSSISDFCNTHNLSKRFKRVLSSIGGGGNVKGAKLYYCDKNGNRLKKSPKIIYKIEYLKQMSYKVRDKFKNE